MVTTAGTPIDANVPRETDEDPVATERAQVTRLAILEREWSARRRDAATDLADREQRSGDDVVAAALAGDGVDRLRGLAEETAIARAELETIDHTIASTRSHREAAIRALFAAEAAELRRQAAALLSEADGRSSRTAQLLAELEAWEGVRYAPERPVAPPQRIYTRLGADGQPEVVPPAAVPYGSLRGDMLRGPSAPLAGLHVVVVPTPRTQLLRNQAGDLERRAIDVAARPVDRSGYAEDIRSIEGLVDIILGDEMRIGPPVVDVVAWAEQALATENARRQEALRRYGDEVARNDGLGRAIAFTIAWSDGQLKPRECRAVTVLDEDER
jgi:hypothetical protein